MDTKKKYAARKDEGGRPAHGAGRQTDERRRLHLSTFRCETHLALTWHMVASSFFSCSFGEVGTYVRFGSASSRRFSHAHGTGVFGPLPLALALFPSPSTAGHVDVCPSPRGLGITVPFS